MRRCAGCGTLVSISGGQTRSASGGAGGILAGSIRGGAARPYRQGDRAWARLALDYLRFEARNFMAKKLIVLSDGTGNSAAKLFKTNVWKLYEALDLTPPSDQIALYDDGVGTSRFKPWALLTGAFGFGLKRNVLKMYVFLSRH